MFTVRIVYFKTSGKWYAEETYQVTSKPKMPVSPTAEPYMYDVVEEVKALNPHPGLVKRWAQGSILVEPVEDWGFPVLIRID